MHVFGKSPRLSAVQLDLGSQALAAVHDLRQGVTISCNEATLRRIELSGPAPLSAGAKALLDALPESRKGPAGVSPIDEASATRLALFLSIAAMAVGQARAGYLDETLALVPAADRGERV